MEKPLQVFCCYAREDQQTLLMLKKPLRPIQREGLIVVQADIDVSPGEEWEQKISHYLNTAQIILLLISPDFMDSDYCYSKEMTRAMERHDRGEASVIPIILRPTRWQRTPLGKLQALPTNAEPVTSKYWHTLDDAFFDVEKGIEKAAEELIIQSRSNASVTLREQANKTSLVIYRGHNTSPGNSITWSHDGKQLATGGSSGLVHIWSMSTGNTILTWDAHATALINRVAWSPDGQWLASASGDQTVKVWEASSGRMYSACMGHASSVWAVAWSPDSRLLASASYDGSVKVWEASSGKERFTFTGHSGPVTAVA